MRKDKFILIFIFFPFLAFSYDLLNFEAYNKEGKKEKIFNEEKNKFLILLNPKTCIAYYEERGIWQKICDDFKDWIECSAVVLGNKNDLEKLEKHLNLKINIYYTEEKDLEKILKPIVYPMKYLINKNGDIIYFSYPNKEKIGKECLYKEIENILYLFEPEF